MTLLEVWQSADPVINASLAIALASLSFAAATFLLRWVSQSKQSAIAHFEAGNEEAENKAREAFRSGRQGVRNL